ncbi:MAG: FGGY-family carbohydrate kinase [Acidithiobacillus sp.]
MYLGIDFGSSGVRGVLMDSTLQVRAPAALPLADGLDDPGAWLALLQPLFRELRAQCAEGMEALRALTIDGTSGTLLLCDGLGQPLFPALLYYDQRATAEAQEIAQSWPRAGIAAEASSSLAKLLWLWRHVPAVRGAHFLHHQADWVAARLTGKLGLSDRGNLVKLGLDGQTLRYPPPLLELLGKRGIPAQILPQARREGADLGPVRPDWAAHLGIPADTRVRAGCTDSIAAAIAAGLHEPGQALSSLGSSLAIKVASPRPVVDTAAGIYSHVLDDLYLVGAASNSGGAALLRHFSRQEMMALSSRLDPSQPTGTLVYPLPGMGERFPRRAAHWPGSAPPEGPPAWRFQALLEGVAYIEAWAYALLAEHGAPCNGAIRSLGGGVINAAWMQMRANILNRPIAVLSDNEAALGAALLAAAPDVGGLHQVQEWRRPEMQVITPTPAAVAAYAPYTAAFRRHFADAGNNISS